MLFVGHDWARDQHDVEVRDPCGQRWATARLPEGVMGVAAVHELIGRPLGDDADAGAGEVVSGIETDHGLWVAALVAAGSGVYALHPLQVARYRERQSVSGAKSDAADAPTLPDRVRTDAHQWRPVADDSPRAEALKVVARAHKTLSWERTRHSQRPRPQLLDYSPAALAAFEDLAALDPLALLHRAPDPGSAAR